MIEVNEYQIEKVLSGFHIPAKPELLQQLQNLLDHDEPDIDKISSLIASDPALAASILKIINSPSYGMNRSISDVKQSVMILGLKTINSLVTAMLLKNAFKGESSISLEDFWDSSVDIANAMMFLGNHIRRDVSIDLLYTVGLFVNCGMPLLALKYGNYGRLLKKAESLEISSIRLEDKFYQTNHAVLGYYLASSWHLPKHICNLILNHHDMRLLTQKCGSEEQVTFAVLKASENLIQRLKHSENIDEWQSIESLVLDTLGIDVEEYEDLNEDFVGTCI